jgi:hypothetical protein
MDFVEFKFWKLVALGVIVFVVCFLYAAITGRSIQEDWSARKGQRDRPGSPD